QCGAGRGIRAADRRLARHRARRLRVARQDLLHRVQHPRRAAGRLRHAEPGVLRQADARPLEAFRLGQERDEQDGHHQHEHRLAHPRCGAAGDVHAPAHVRRRRAGGLLILADSGELDLDAPVARYWPEFAANGKSAIRVRHLLSFSSGVSGWEQPLQIEDLCDWDKCTSLLAAQAPWWQPGTASGYHSLNYGFLVGEVVRRITGRKTGEYFAQDVAQRLKADFHIGVPDGEFHRIASVIPPEVGIDVSSLDRSTPAYKTLSNPALDARASWTDAWRRADIAACNGHGNARSVARVQSIIANGGEAGGVRLLSTRGVARIFQPQVNGIDLVLGMPLKMGMGFGLPQPQLTPFIPDGRCAFWGGWGGSIVLADADRRMTIAYVMNKMEGGTVGGTNAAELVACAYNSFGV